MKKKGESLLSLLKGKTVLLLRKETIIPEAYVVIRQSNLNLATTIGFEVKNGYPHLLPARLSNTTWKCNFPWAHALRVAHYQTIRSVRASLTVHYLQTGKNMYLLISDREPGLAVLWRKSHLVKQVLPTWSLEFRLDLEADYFSYCKRDQPMY